MNFFRIPYLEMRIESVCFNRHDTRICSDGLGHRIPVQFVWVKGRADVLALGRAEVDRCIP